jgi:hypothetical protein
MKPSVNLLPIGKSKSAACWRLPTSRQRRVRAGNLDAIRHSACAAVDPDELEIALLNLTLNARDRRTEAGGPSLLEASLKVERNIAHG